MSRKPYPSDESREEWAFVAPYLTLITEEAPQRGHSLREVFNGLRWMIRTGATWRMMPHDLPPWDTVYQQSRRWIKAGVLRRSWRICGKFCGLQRARKRNRRRLFLIREPCNRRPNQASEPSMMERNGDVEAKRISRSIPWGICWHYWSRPPTSRIERWSANWRKKCRK